MKETKVGEAEISLLPLFPLIQKLVFAELDRKAFTYTKTQLLILTALQRCGSLCMSQLARFIASSNEQATRAVAPLVEHGLVERFIDPGNRKMVHIRLSDEGFRYIQELSDMCRANLYEHIHDRLSAEEVEDLRDALGTAIELLSRL